LAAQSDSIKTKNLFPVIKSDKFGGVVPVVGIDELPDPKLNYNIVADFTAYAEMDKKKDAMDSSQINWGLSNIGRIINLHAVGGISPNKIKIVLAVHGYALFSLLNNEAYKAKYKINNPNLVLIEELSKAGVRFLICGQAMSWMNVKKADLIPQAKVTLTAQTTLTSYQLKGYAFLDQGND
jgi:intracellular sulfur oxidation DsrE/DsrF family protein